MKDTGKTGLWRAAGGAARAGLVALAASCWLGACATVDEPAEESLTGGSGGVDISPALAAQEGRHLKHKVVIARFTNETLYGKSVLLEGKADLVARQASDILAARLAASGKFLLFERTDPRPLLAALDRGELGSSGLPADLLIIGSVSEFGRETTSKTGVFSRTKLQRTRARVNVRLVDVKSSRVIFAQEGTGVAESEVGTVLGVGTKAAYDSTLNDKAISASISKVVGNLMEKLLDRPWRSYVLAAEGGVVTIGGGKSQGIAAGDRFALLRKGKSVKNPQTGAEIELPGTRVARLEVTDVLGDSPETEIARCRVVEGEPPGEDLGAYVVEEEEDGR